MFPASAGAPQIVNSFLNYFNSQVQATAVQNVVVFLAIMVLFGLVIAQ